MLRLKKKKTNTFNEPVRDNSVLFAFGIFLFHAVLTYLLLHSVVTRHNKLQSLKVCAGEGNENKIKRIRAISHPAASLLIWLDFPVRRGMKLLKKVCPVDKKQPAMKANTIKADDGEYKYAWNPHTLSEESRQKHRR